MSKSEMKPLTFLRARGDICSFSQNNTMNPQGKKTKSQNCCQFILIELTNNFSTD